MRKGNTRLIVAQKTVGRARRGDVTLREANEF